MTTEKPLGSLDMDRGARPSHRKEAQRRTVGGRDLLVSCLWELGLGSSLEDLLGGDGISGGYAETGLRPLKFSFSSGVGVEKLLTLSCRGGFPSVRGSVGTSFDYW